MTDVSVNNTFFVSKDTFTISLIPDNLTTTVIYNNGNDSCYCKQYNFFVLKQTFFFSFSLSN